MLTREQRLKILKRKLRRATVFYDLRTNDYPLEKQVKHQDLMDISEFFSKRGVLDLSVLDSLMVMVEGNLFRTPPPCPLPIDVEVDFSEDYTFPHPQWLYLDLVYEILAKVLLCPDLEPRLVPGFSSRFLVRNLIGQLDSWDERERMAVRICLHIIYARWARARPVFREEIVKYLQAVSLTGEVHHGVSEALDIMGSIVSGFSLPLKLEHRELINKAFLPLHRVKYLRSFHRCLTVCVEQMVAKDIHCAEIVIKGILARWPSAECNNGALLLREIESVLAISNAAIFRGACPLLLRRLAACMRNGQIVLIERCFSILNNPTIRSYMETEGTMGIIVPVICQPLLGLKDSHWHEQVRSNAAIILEYFFQNGGDAFASLVAPQALRPMPARGAEEWDRITAMALANDPFFTPPVNTDHPRCGRRIHRRALESVSASHSVIHTDPRSFVEGSLRDLLD